MALNGIVKSQFLLFKNSLLSTEALTVSCNCGEGVLLFDQLSLVGDPFLLDLSDLIFHIIDFFLNVVFLGLKWTGIFILTILLL